MYAWRPILLGALIGMLIAQVLVMKWLAEAQVEAGIERQAREAAARAAQARCFEAATHRTKDACRVGLATADGGR
ncbi:general secretion pathway protein GspL [Variovorax sp. J22G21]|uniref:general secretion pathway protein GspL n=1 Tax=Variovorax fucosicus TaxID=3053517 RepID=UPI002574EC97|nr:MULTISPECIES: general secretion pathway protein GspL [unclassified Variovorax]MDM0039034.1 general secretion pathway protein GspL [Variovorax sp. J22R193]MDM0063810.1 general secretion pathway protein GspL [Variovorax sp. J22G21]